MYVFIDVPTQHATVTRVSDVRYVIAKTICAATLEKVTTH